MPAAASQSTTPYSDVSAFLVERNYKSLGCDGWDARRVRVLIAKIGDTETVFAARLRVPGRELRRKLAEDIWTKQDGLILTMLEREIDFARGQVVPEGRIA